MPAVITRRGFLGCTALLGTIPATSRAWAGRDPLAQIPLVDYHVHLDENVTLEKAVALSEERKVKFGIVEHAGTKENKYAGLLSSDKDLKAYLAKLEGKPVYRGIQAEGLDWMSCFSKQAVAELDYVLSDALTFPEKNGQRVELWRPWVRISNSQDFMDRYVDFHLKVLSVEPLDILANPTFLPECLMADFDMLWTPKRMRRIVDAAVKYNVAIEINSRYRLPRLPFLRMARDAGARFSFGSNIHGLDVGKLDYCVEMARTLELDKSRIFTPAPYGRKPIQLRTATARPAPAIFHTLVR